MNLIIKPTERCNFKCTFCSSSHITHDNSTTLDLAHIYEFLTRFPETSTIIVNGGDPLMVSPDYYWSIIQFLEQRNMDTIISLTTNLWPFYKNQQKWAPLLTHRLVKVITSFQYGTGRLKGDGSVFSEADFWKCSDAMLDVCGYRPDFITVVTNESAKYAIKNVELAKRMGVECKLNNALSSGLQGGDPYMLSKMYEIYVDIWKQGLHPWEYNTKQMMKRLRDEHTTCPQNRQCDEGIRALQPSGDYYSCGAFGDDMAYKIDFRSEMQGAKIYPLRNVEELNSMKEECFTCDMFRICNGCKKTIQDMKRHNMVEAHCSGMKAIASDIIESNRMPV